MMTSGFGTRFIPTVQKRGAAVIEARGQSSAASAANAAINHVQSWYHGTAQGDWASMGVASTGAYGTPEGVIFSYPVTIKNGEYSDRRRPGPERLRSGHDHAQRRRTA